MTHTDKADRSAAETLVIGQLELNRETRQELTDGSPHRCGSISGSAGNAGSSQSAAWVIAFGRPSNPGCNARLARLASPLLLCVVAAGACLAAPPGPGQGPKQADPPGKGEFKIDPARTILNNVGAGEVQSAVIPPGKKAQCPKGRLLFSRDDTKGGPSQLPKGTVLYRDLDNLDGSNDEATFAPFPNSDLGVWSSDHDLVVLPNGDVLCVWMGRSKAPLSPKPDWFDVTMKVGNTPGQDWGPGARSAIMVWRSTDGGQHFEFLTWIDMAGLEGGWPAYPQSTGSRLGPDLGPPYYNMGGTDGPLAKVDPATGRVYLTLGCVGNQDGDPASGKYQLGPALKATLVLASSDQGASWQTLGTLEGASAWRLGVVPLKPNRLAFGWGNTIRFGEKGPSGKWVFEQDGVETALPALLGWKPAWDWGQKWSKTPQYAVVYANIDAHSRIFRSPNHKSVVLVHEVDYDQEGKGYAVFFYDLDKKQYGTTGKAGIVPKVKHPENFVLHPTIVDAGSGPLLLYWYDVAWNANPKVATMRGKLLTKDNSWSSDFSLSWKTQNLITTPDSFELGSGRWYGDYHTAGGYREFSGGAPGLTTMTGTTYHYYPVWVEPGGKLRFAHVRCRLPLPAIDDTQTPLTYFELAKKDWRAPARRGRSSTPFKREEK